MFKDFPGLVETTANQEIQGDKDLQVNFKIVKKKVCGKITSYLCRLVIRVRKGWPTGYSSRGEHVGTNL